MGNIEVKMLCLRSVFHCPFIVCHSHTVCHLDPEYVNFFNATKMKSFRIRNSFIAKKVYTLHMITRLDPLSAGLTMIECVFRSSFKAFSSSLVRFSGSGSFLVLLSARLSCLNQFQRLVVCPPGLVPKWRVIGNGAGFPFWVLFLKKVDHLSLRWYCCTCSLHDSRTFLILVPVGTKESPLYSKLLC